VGKLIYSMSVSADGYIVGPDGKFDWAMPDEELHRFHNEQTRALAGHLLGRRLYETMVYWETADKDSAAVMREFALIWQALPKVVFSTTLENVEGNTRLARDSVSDEVRRLKEELDGDLAVGGAELAASCIELDLVDEYGLFVYPVIVGGGKAFFPSTHASLELELVETRSFASRVVYLRYRRPRRA
jgi:dihydrofolate reductase